MDLSDLQNLMDNLSRTPEEETVLTDDQEKHLRVALEEHPDWTDELRTFEPFDQRLCQAMSDIEIPEGLAERLLAEIVPEVGAATPPSDSIPLTQANTDQRRPEPSRRRVLGILSAAALLFSASVWSIFSSLSPDLTVAQIQNELPKLWEESEQSLSQTGSESSMPAPPFAALLPSDGWQTSRLSFSTNWQFTEIPAATGSLVAFRRFSFHTSNRVQHQGLLVSLPASRFSVDERPKSSSPFSADIRYFSTSDGTSLAVVTWTDSQTESVYFLTVPAGKRTLNALESLFYIRPA